MIAPELLDEVRATLSEQLDITITPDQDNALLAEVAPGRYDSLAVIDCVGVIEQRFDVSIDLVDDDLRTTFASVSAIAGLVTRKRHDLAVLRAGL